MQTENTATEVNNSAPLIDPIDPPAAAPASAPAEGTDQVDTTTEKADDEGKQQEGEHAERDEQGRFKPKVQKRIDELTHARRTAERERDYWRSQAERQATATPAPQAHEFATDEDYEKAARTHEIKQAAREEMAETAKATSERYAQDASNALDQTYAQRVESAKVRYPDFVQALTTAKVDIPPEMIPSIKESEYGADIAYMLAKNPDEAQRLAGLSTRQLDREIGRMEASFASKGAAPAPAQAAPAPVARTTSAPPPVKPSGAGGAPPSGNLDTMSQAEFEAAMRARGSKHI